MPVEIDETEWLISAKKALDWMIEFITVPEWSRRRLAVVKYFRSINRQLEHGIDSDSSLGKKGFAPTAVYNDWMAWYMYLIENIFERPFNDEPWQKHRIAPFFALIGRYLDQLQKMPGFDARAKSLLNPNNRNPDNTLYEIAVAISYHRNGWQVEFLLELSSIKTPDLRVTKGAQSYWVECKRFAKVTDYAEKERQAWMERVNHLFIAMEQIGEPVFAEVVFKVPLEEVEPVQLGGAFYAYMKRGIVKMGQTLKHELLDLTVNPIDLKAINKILDESPTRLGSPLMLQILTGNYDMHGQYTQRVAPVRFEVVFPDDELQVFNQFCSELKDAYLVKWECIAEKSLDLKFKDIRKRLSEAVSQIPDEGEGIIHIGYETVSGPEVELKRHDSINRTINSFDFANKRVKAVYCNSFQLLSTAEGFEWAESTIFHESGPTPILVDRSILDLPSEHWSDATHWEEDIANRKI